MSSDAPTEHDASTMASPPLPRVAWLGLGLMGGRMARRLLDVGYPLTVWNRSPEKAAPLLACGARLAPSAADACARADLVCVMLSDAGSVRSVLFADGAAAAIPRGGLVIDMGSNAPSDARDHAGRLAALAVRHLDAPVSGGPGGAEQGTLAIMVGGDEADYERARPLLVGLGRPTLVGPTGSGQLAKLCNQTIVALTIGAVAEALLLARAAGANPAKVREALAGGYADSLILQVHGQRMIDRVFDPGGPCRLQLKDLRNILGTAAEHGVRLPLAEHVASLYELLVARGGGELDHSALLLEIERVRTGPSGAETGR